VCELWLLLVWRYGDQWFVLRQLILQRVLCHFVGWLMSRLHHRRYDCVVYRPFVFVVYADHGLRLVQLWYFIELLWQLLYGLLRIFLFVEHVVHFHLPFVEQLLFVGWWLQLPVWHVGRQQQRLGRAGHSHGRDGYHDDHARLCVRRDGVFGLRVLWLHALCCGP